MQLFNNRTAMHSEISILIFDLYPEQSPMRLNDTAEILISVSLILIHAICSGKNPQKF